ncbi:aminoglycoside phosphotransferase family protein [Pseudonocardia humida]|uniref:Phosphotransferase n=1 Tax=Pseudonocardia humida TaxID=2800819 RepID=A0ABT1A5P2_9PSEU|nr:aminoglycoside phosphotransferase family protein [Pseudonocardia humida]MCO1658333.1 phosphotransferase [Pseudonocardia humida]
MIEVPGALRRNAVAAWGEQGRRWLAELPESVADVCRSWGLELGEPYALSFHWVARVRRDDGTAAVLKLGPPESDDLRREALALGAYGGDGAVRLLARDPGRGAVLLERAEPGRMVRELVPRRDADATAATVDVLRRLHAADVVDGLPDVATLGADFARHLGADHGRGPLPRVLVERAAELLGDLCASAERRVVLHGDLHHDNVLRHGDGWVAIDPHGAVGDPGFDVGPPLYNPDPDRVDGELLALVPARVEQLADGLGIALDRASAWGFVAAVLSEVWDAEGGASDGGRALRVAELLVRRLD